MPDPAMLTPDVAVVLSEDRSSNVHGYHSAVTVALPIDWLPRGVVLENCLPGDAVDAIAANKSICLVRRAVVEGEYYGANLVVLRQLNVFQLLAHLDNAVWNMLGYLSPKRTSMHDDLRYLRTNVSDVLALMRSCPLIRTSVSSCSFRAADIPS